MNTLRLIFWMTALSIMTLQPANSVFKSLSRSSSSLLKSLSRSSSSRLSEPIDLGSDYVATVVNKRFAGEGPMGKLAELVAQLELDGSMFKTKTGSPITATLISKCVHMITTILKSDSFLNTEKMWPLMILLGLDAYLISGGRQIEHFCPDRSMNYEVKLLLLFAKDLKHNLAKEINKIGQNPELLDHPESLNEGPDLSAKSPDPELVECFGRARLLNHHMILKLENSPKIQHAETGIEEIVRKYLMDSRIAGNESTVNQIIYELLDQVKDSGISEWEKYYAAEICVHLAKNRSDFRTIFEEKLASEPELSLQFYSIYAERNTKEFFGHKHKVRKLLLGFENTNESPDIIYIHHIIHKLNSADLSLQSRITIHHILMSSGILHFNVRKTFLDYAINTTTIPLGVAEVWNHIFRNVEIHGPSLSDFEYMILRKNLGYIVGARRALHANKMLTLVSNEAYLIANDAYIIQAIAQNLESLPWKQNQDSMKKSENIFQLINIAIMTDQFQWWHPMLCEGYLHLFLHNANCGASLASKIYKEVEFRTRMRHLINKAVKEPRSISLFSPRWLKAFALEFKALLDSEVFNDKSLVLDEGYFCQWAVELQDVILGRRRHPVPQDFIYRMIS